MNKQTFTYDGSEFKVTWPKGTSNKLLPTACMQFCDRLRRMNTWNGEYYTIGVENVLKEFSYVTNFKFEALYLNQKLRGKE